MRERSLCITIQVDALRADFFAREGLSLSDSLRQDIQSGSLMPTFGFEPDAAYLAGEFPDRSDGGAHFWREPEATPFGVARYLPSALDQLPELPSKIFRRFLDVSLRRIYPIPTLTTARIPLRRLPAFGVPKKVPFGADGFTSTPSIFDHMRAEKRPFLLHVCPQHRVGMMDVIARVENELHPPLEFAFLHIGNLDRIGHRHGPDSPELRREVQRVFNGLRRIAEIARKRFSQLNWIVFGDHGMSEIRQHVDVQSLITKLPIAEGKDYEMFLDSTMARFWFFNSRAKELVASCLLENPDGIVLGEGEVAKYHLNYGHNRFGDLIFVVHQNRLIIPNYFQGRQPIKGMHGYLPECPDQQSFFAVTAERSTWQDGPQDMRRIFPTCMKLLGFEQSTWKGLEPIA